MASLQAAPGPDGDPEIVCRPAVASLVRIQIAGPCTGATHETEVQSLVALLIEGGLAAVANVTPQVETAPASPGLQGALHVYDQVCLAAVSAEPEQGTSARGQQPWNLSLTLCAEVAGCASSSARADLGQPASLAEAVATLLDAASTFMGVEVPEQVSRLWSLPESADRYALILAGRSAAILYGYWPVPAPAVAGDARRDPVSRAVYIDPRMPVGQWLAGRHAMLRGTAAPAHEAFSRAAGLRPEVVLYAADAAASRGNEGSWEQAWAQWQTVARRSGGDLRFGLPHAEAGLRTGRLSEARALLATVPGELHGHAPVLRLQALLMERAGITDYARYDDLLTRWQQAAPALAEPLRRRIDWRLHQSREQQRYDEAYRLAEQLAAVEPGERAARQAMSLAIAAGDWQGAESAAEALGLPQVVRAVRIRAALQADSRALPPELAVPQNDAERLVSGEISLASGRPADAEAQADDLLTSEPWMPEALWLLVRALTAQGKEAEAKQARARLAYADPAWRTRGFDLTLPGGSGVPGSSAAQADPAMREAVSVRSDATAAVATP